MLSAEASPTQFDAIADALGDSPFTVISTHLLRRRWCRVYLIGTPSHFDALVLHHKDDPSEPTSYGGDAEAIWRLVQGIVGWTCVESSLAVTPVLGRLMGQTMGVGVRFLDDLHHTLTTPAPDIAHPDARLLTHADLPLIEAAQPGTARAQIEWILAHGAMAGAVVAGQVVAVAQTYAISPMYCDLGVHTHEAFRRRGYSTACAALVAKTMQQRGLIPVWSTGAHNAASLRVAAKLGFREIGRMQYAIPVFTTANTERTEIHKRNENEDETEEI